MQKNNMLCVCGSKKIMSKCCERFLSGASHANTPEQLMRSRYSAFMQGGHGQYLLDTWLPAMTQGLNAYDLSHSPISWKNLQINSKSQTGDDGMVEFTASYIDENGENGIHHEKSVFKRIAGRWLYVGGEVTDERS